MLCAHAFLKTFLARVSSSYKYTPQGVKIFPSLKFPLLSNSIFSQFPLLSISSPLKSVTPHHFDRTSTLPF